MQIIPLPIGKKSVISHPLVEFKIHLHIFFFSFLLILISWLIGSCLLSYCLFFTHEITGEFPNPAASKKEESHKYSRIFNVTKYIIKKKEKKSILQDYNYSFLAIGWLVEWFVQWITVLGIVCN